YFNTIKCFRKSNQGIFYYVHESIKGDEGMSVDRLEEQKLWEGLHPKTKHGISSIMRDVTFKDGRAIANSTGKDVTHLVDVTIKTSGKQVRGLKDRDELSRHQADNGGYIFAFFKRVTTIEER